MIRLAAEECRDFSREWLETNGIGGFASSTACGLNTRRYHGLLTAALDPPVGRHVLLSKLECALVIDGEPFPLSVNRYPGVLHPEGHLYLQELRLDPFPVWTYEVAGAVLEQRLFMVRGENTTVVRWRLRKAPTGTDVALEVRPLIAFRDYHGLTRENPYLRPGYDARPGLLTLSPYDGLPSLHLSHDAPGVEAEGHWYRRFQYDVERERGLDFEEDLFNPCCLRFEMREGEDRTLIASTEHHSPGEAAQMESAERARRARTVEAAPSSEPLVRALTMAADQFLVARGSGSTVIAGYPWFADWGRDTMIALPGLTLYIGREECAREVLLEYLRHVDSGLLPNRFPDAGQAPEYNTVDATLWYFQAARCLAVKTDDWQWVRRHLYPTLVEIVEWHMRGTRHGIRMDQDCLLRAGEPGCQLTWMDAKVGDRVITPRWGRPAEIQALWYNALRFMEELAGDDGQAATYRETAGKAARSFNRLFWNAERQCLHDVVADDGTPDPSLRPNQVFAVSLPHSMLSRARSRAVVRALEEHLLTPYGLRTLAPDDPRYAGTYSGPPAARDGVYHQGTVWPWLLGPFLTAYVRVHDGSPRSRGQVRAWMEPLRGHLLQAGLGQVSEILEGQAPHIPRGCPAQAWSVGELLRACVEDAEL